MGSTESLGAQNAGQVNGSNLIGLPGGGIASVNGDVGPAITLQTAGGQGLNISNPGPGVIEIDSVNFTNVNPGRVPNPGGQPGNNFLGADGAFHHTPTGADSFSQVTAPGVAVAGGVPVVVVTQTMPGGTVFGIYMVQVFCGVAGIVASNFDAVIKVNGSPVPNHFSDVIEEAGLDKNIAWSFFFALTTGDVLTLEIAQSVAASTTTSCGIEGFLMVAL